MCRTPQKLICFSSNSLQRNSVHFDPANKMVSDFELYDSVPTKKKNNNKMQRSNAAKRRRSCIGMGLNKKRPESNKRVSFGVVDVRLFEKKGHMNNTVDLGAIAFNEIHVSNGPLSQLSQQCLGNHLIVVSHISHLYLGFSGQKPGQQLPVRGRQ